MRKLLVATVLVTAFAVPAGAGAEHAGCLATTAEPTCTYTALGSHSAIPLSQAGWEIYVTRSGQKVVLAGGGAGGQFGEIVPVAAEGGELVTVSILPDGPGGLPLGAITSGNTSGHI